MKSPRMYCVLLVAALGTPTDIYSQAAAGLATDSSTQRELDQALNAAVAHGDVPGVVAIAANRNGVIYQGAFGLAETTAGRAMTSDAIFRTASMGKAVTSVALMQLVEEGRVALDDPASKYLPELADLVVLTSFDPVTGRYTVKPAEKSVTVRNLLTHTSGLGYAFTSAVVRDFKPRDGDHFAAGPLLFEPGAQWLYGTSMDWIGRLVESISGKTLEVYFQERIFLPLGMTDTSYNIPTAKRARLVNVYNRIADGSLEEHPRRVPQLVTQFDGGGGLYSSARDYLRFLQMLLNGGELNGARILSRDTVTLMSRNQMGAIAVRALKSAQPERSEDFTFVADGRDKWGIGFMITTDAVPGKRSAGSLSWGGIYNTYFWFDPVRGVAGVIMMQFLPFADPKALAVYETFERGIYKMTEK